MKTYNKRPIYLDKIRPFMGKDIIKVLIGQRRVGKSYVLFQIIDELKQSFGVREDQIIYVNKELNEFDTISDYNDLLSYIKKDNSKEKRYVFIDEIQDIVNFEKALRDLQTLGNYDIYISGSNANMLSSEIATYLTGRYIEFEIFPLNYREFLDFHTLKNSKESFLSYMKFGGLPYLKNLKLEEDIVYDYIKSVYNTILLKDIVIRYGIRNIDFLNKLIYYLGDNIGSLFSANSISQYLKSQKVEIGTNVVLEYLHYITSVFLVNKVKRQEIIGKKIFEINDKFYFSDVGIRNAILGGYRQFDISKIIENLVFLHFKALGYQIHIGKNKTKEIDFIVQKGSDIKYIQVCYLLVDESTRQREFGNLLEIKDNYEKIVLSMDDFISGDYMGIKHYNLVEYLSRE
ncbi:ATP-binding protein [Candidatus Gracilibacteria bacterium]|nr:ATP-binding protein [Candidatus Gracilibacteria bacterium]OIO76158.1 MAG: ATPase [Candidatus Gracilibacteria bacterium CG1_02_38_174]PIZ01565.1 MAG: ATPase [Candidatus Gracilibacteria bacterium CG_4_10_14_0_8_um_filter_38_28]